MSESERKNPEPIDYNRLFEGIRDFKTNEFIPRQQFFEELGQQIPCQPEQGDFLEHWSVCLIYDKWVTSAKRSSSLVWQWPESGYLCH